MGLVGEEERKVHIEGVKKTHGAEVAAAPEAWFAHLDHTAALHGFDDDGSNFLDGFVGEGNDR